MRLKTEITIGWIWIGLFTFGIGLSAAEKTTLLALGDSITQGGKHFTCYREVLIPELRKKGKVFEFIGPNQDKSSAHAGFGGKNTKYLRQVVQKIYQAYPADIVLLHSGHNSFNKDKPVDGIVADTEAIIETIGRLNPKAVILLGQVIPAGKLPKYAYIPALNRALKSSAERMNAKGRRVVLVDHEAGFDWKTDTVKDKVHPNSAGAKKMANTWMEALLPLL